jgi:hypothetical protein
MGTVEPHEHGFPVGKWPFKEPINTVAFTSVKVAQEGAPVLLVFHDHDGEWQFLHGNVTDEDKCLLTCMGCAFERTPEIAILANLPSGWYAERTSLDANWVCEPYEDDDE